VGLVDQLSAGDGHHATLSYGELHDRMPVILAEGDWPKWLGEEWASEQDLLALLKPCADLVLKIWLVDKMVGNVKNNGPQLIAPVPL
jgi:putative SOS response-associated peptidase YedK